MTLDVSRSFSWASEMPHMSKRFFSSGSRLFSCNDDNTEDVWTQRRPMTSADTTRVYILLTKDSWRSDDFVCFIGLWVRSPITFWDTQQVITVNSHAVNSELFFFSAGKINSVSHRVSVTPGGRQVELQAAWTLTTQKPPGCEPAAARRNTHTSCFCRAAVHSGTLWCVTDMRDHAVFVIVRRAWSVGFRDN